MRHESLRERKKEREKKPLTRETRASNKHPQRTFLRRIPDQGTNSCSRTPHPKPFPHTTRPPAPRLPCFAVLCFALLGRPRSLPRFTSMLGRRDPAHGALDVSHQRLSIKASSYPPSVFTSIPLINNHNDNSSPLISNPINLSSLSP